MSLGGYSTPISDQENALMTRINMLTNLAHAFMQCGEQEQAAAVLRDARTILGPSSDEFRAWQEERRIAAAVPAAKKSTAKKGARL